MQNHPFKPIIFSNTTTLILGSFPSIKSFENSFYYAHPKNQFWTILSQISNYPINNKDQKLWLLKELKLGLWDIVKSCKRENSSDSNLKDITPNNIEALLKEYPAINKIAFTSHFAQKIYNKYFGSLDINTIYLPSPSPAYAAMSFEQKCKIYKEKLL
jgi:hypoxanthine-DNA glycosylase